MDSIKNFFQNITSSYNNSQLQIQTPQRTWLEYFQTKNFIIILLIIIIILLFLGINVFILFGKLFQTIIYALKPLISSILLLFGVSINTIGDIFDGIGDIIDSILHFFGNGIQYISKYPLTNNDTENQFWNYDKVDNNIYYPNDTNNIEQSNTSKKSSSWCLIGDTYGSRTCVPIKDSTKCMSGMVYDNEQMCINPVTTYNNPINRILKGNGNNSEKINKVYYPNQNNNSLNSSTFLNNVVPITSLPTGQITSSNANVQNIKTTIPNNIPLK